ncbi:hypothetical protein D3C81_1627520 [compost metagenome]
MRDTGLDTLLDLNGTRFVLDEAGIYWVKFDISACAVSASALYHRNAHTSSGIA